MSTGENYDADGNLKTTLSGAAAGVPSLDDLTDVTITGSGGAGVQGSILRKGASVWEDEIIADESVVARVGGGDVAYVTMGESTFLARLASGSIVAATVAQIKTLLNYVFSDIGGTLAHASLGSVTADQHHNQSHNHSSAGDGTSLSPATLVLPTATSPAQTAEGSVVWDSDDDILTVGDGSARSEFGKLGTTNPQPVGTAAPGNSKEAARVNHVHAKPTVALNGTGSDLSATGPGHVIQASAGANLTVLMHKLDATASPTVNDDSGDGYAIGSLWIDTTNDTIWQATDVTVGAAVWHQLDGAAGSGISTVQENGANVVTSADLLDFKDFNVEDLTGGDAAVYTDQPDLNGGRLTLSSGVPVTTSDVTGAGTLYFTPYKHDKISLFDGTRWKKYTFSEISLALTSLIKGVVYDIFLYDNSSTLTLEALALKKVAASNSPTAGANKVINLTDTAGLVIGMEVTVKDGTNSEVTNITAVVASTSITVDNLANAYTTPDVYGYPTRATAIVQQNGRMVKSGATTRRYLGSIRISRTATAQCEDTMQERFVYNYDNRVTRILKCTDTTNSWTDTSASVKAANASVAYGVGRVGFVLGVSEDIVRARYWQPGTASAAGTTVGGCIGLNRTLTNDADYYGMVTVSGGICVQTLSEYTGHPPIGSNYLQRETIGATTTTYYGDNGGTAVKCGMVVEIQA